MPREAAGCSLCQRKQTNPVHMDIVLCDIAQGAAAVPRPTLLMCLSQGWHGLKQVEVHTSRCAALSLSWLSGGPSGKQVTMLLFVHAPVDMSLLAHPCQAMEWGGSSTPRGRRGAAG